VHFVDAMMAWAEANYCVDPSRWYSIGFSWGGWMANHVGCARAQRIRAVISVAGGGPSIACEGPVAVMIVHGTADTDEPIAEGQASMKKWTAANGCQANTEPALSGACVRYLGCSAGHPVLWCEHAGGHEKPAFLTSGAVWSWLSQQ
jgi:polyhydroxybutyrate depolymerase